MERLPNRVFLALALTVAGLAAACGPVNDEQAPITVGVQSIGLADDGASHPPPATGTYAYNSFVPASAGSSYTDPVLGSVVRRITADNTVDDIYARNMFWSANGTRYLHRNAMGGPFSDFFAAVDPSTGQITHNGIPIGSIAADAGFDPVDPNVLYYYNGSTIHRVTLGSGSTWTDDVYFTAPGNQTILTLGGSMNWLDASGRYMVVRYGSEPSVRVYDRQNMAAGPYANPVDAQYSIDPGSYIGITPDGKYLVGYERGGGHNGFYNVGQGVSWLINHTNRSIATAPTIFWSLCGDHGSFISPADGRDYMITFDCSNNTGLWRVDITNSAAGLDQGQQQALPHNQRLVAWPTWNDSGHITTVAKGPLADWAFVSTEDATDVFNGGISPWHAYRQEIIGFNVITGEIQRLAHHRSRSIGNDYYFQPRLSASWGGEYVGWPSNFNQQAAGVDIYVLQFAGSASGPTISSVSSSGVTASGATITWTTSPAADSQVDYGLTTAYGSSTTLDASLVTSHSQTLSGLTASSTYHYRVKSRNSGGVLSVSGDYTFTTGGGCTGTFSISPTSQSMAAGAGTGTITVTGTTGCAWTAVSNNTSWLTVTSGASGNGSGTVGFSATANTGVARTGTITIAGLTFTLNQATGASAAENVIWTNLVDVTATGNSLQKTGGCDGCAAGAWSQQSISSGNGYLEFTLTETNKIRAGALTATRSTSNSALLDFAISFNTTGIAEVRENGTYKAETQGAAGNVFRIAVESGVVKYYKSGTLFYTSTKTPAFPLYADAILSGLNATITNAVIQLSPSANVIWTNLANVTATGNSLQKTGGCDGCPDAGAWSQQSIASGNGYFEFTATETDKIRSGALTATRSTSNPALLDFAISFNGTLVEVRENGVYKIDVPVTSGNVFRISVASGVVKYYKNGALFYTSTKTPSFPLYADAILNHLNATITNAVIQ